MAIFTPKGTALSLGGRAVGTAIGGPIGGTIGSIIGSVLGSLGGKKRNWHLNDPKYWNFQPLDITAQQQRRALQKEYNVAFRAGEAPRTLVLYDRKAGVYKAAIKKARDF